MKGVFIMRTYEEELQWFKQYKEELEQRELERDDLRFREKDYLCYLQKWFSEEDCDGASAENRIRWKRLPMSFIQYAYH